MVAAQVRQDTVFTVLGDAARRRTPRSLVVQLVVSVAMVAAVLNAASQWWSFAFLAACFAAYAAWGLLIRVVESREAHPRSLDAVLVTIAALGTALAVAGIIGVGLAIYSGNARGVKDACGKGSTNELCQAWANPVPSSRPIP